MEKLKVRSWIKGLWDEKRSLFLILMRLDIQTLSLSQMLSNSGNWFRSCSVGNCLAWDANRQHFYNFKNVWHGRAEKWLSVNQAAELSLVLKLQLQISS